MDHIIHSLKQYKSMVPIYGTTLLFSFHYFLLIYINSSTLSQYWSTEAVGVLYMIGSLITLAIFLLAPFILKKISLYRALFSFLILETLGIILMSLSNNGFTSAIGFVLIQLAVPIIYFTFDVYLQKLSDKDSVGGIRSIFLTLTNMTIIASPIISASLINTYSYNSVYIVSAFFLIPLYIIAYRYYRLVDTKDIKHTTIKDTFVTYLENRDLRRVFEANFILKIFYGVMTIYLPVYLLQGLNFSWDEIGILLTVMLLPFVLFEIPFGNLADKVLGEKEIMITGFVLTGIATFSLGYYAVGTFTAMAALLFSSRVGASAIEMMTETFFFKIAPSNNIDIISFFRITTPLAYIVAPIVSGYVLLNGSYDLLFSLLGVIMLAGSLPAILIHDTK